MKVCELPDDLVRPGLRIRSMADPDLLGTIVFVEHDYKMYVNIEWDKKDPLDKSSVAKHLLGCEVVTDEEGDPVYEAAELDFWNKEGEPVYRGVADYPHCWMKKRQAEEALEQIIEDSSFNKEGRERARICLDILRSEKLLTAKGITEKIKSLL